MTTKNQGCKRGCKWPVYPKKDRYGDEDTFCMGCNKPVEKCDCVKRKPKAKIEPPISIKYQ
jgi:hypothetical protein